MSESIWWPEEHWWEKKVVPLGFVNFSLRQLATLLGGVLLGLLVSQPFGFPIFGVSFGGRALVFFVFVGLGYIIAIRRVKMLPLELQLYYVLRKKALERLRAKLSSVPLFGQIVGASAGSVASMPMSVQEMTVEDFKNPVPFAVTSRVKGLGAKSLVSLYLDDERRSDGTVSPEKPGYRLLYYPRPEDVGTHRLTARLDSTGETLVSVQLDVKTRSPDTVRSLIGG
jgi:hypothetical protein